MRSLPPRLYAVAAIALLVIGLLFGGHQILAVRGTFAKTFPPSQAKGVSIETGAAGSRIVGRLSLYGPPLAYSPLVVVLHGDAPFAKPGYQYKFADEVAASVPGIRVAALLRPGYADPFGGQSDGDRGWFATGDNYTSDVVRQLASAVKDLKTRWQAPYVILVGHSGGAALSAEIAALYPGLASEVILVSCPCDVPAFRQHMAEKSPIWRLPSDSLSPIDSLDTMTPGLIIFAISGEDDRIALPQYAQAYVDKAKTRGISASMITVPKEGHEILLDPLVVQAVSHAVRMIAEPDSKAR